MTEVIFVGDRCNDHSPSSGYDQVCGLFPNSGWLSGRALEAGKTQWHRVPKNASSICPQVFHVIYGDCSGKALPKILQDQFPQTKIVSSVHQPIARLLSDPIASEAIKISNAIITVSAIQAKELENAEPGLLVYPVPHGVWTQAFSLHAGATNQKQKSVLLVGSFLRDWGFALEVANKLSIENVRVIALGAGARNNLPDNSENIDVMPRVSESKLIELYSHASAVFLPFLEATASNALLESMSIGCPVICPRLSPLVGEYLGDDSDAYEQGNSEQAVKRIMHYINNPDIRIAKTATLVDKSKVFDWSRIRPSLMSIYEDVL